MLEALKSIAPRTFELTIQKDVIERISIFTIWLFVCSALIGMSMGYATWFIPKTPVNLILGFVLLVLNVPLLKKAAIASFCGFFALGMLVEMIGVHTGLLFGDYNYGHNLGVKFWGVPIIIGLYWAVLVIITSQMAKRLSANTFTRAITGASLMVFLDYFMEQLAHRFDFWHFTGGLADIENYVAWFIVAFAMHLVANTTISKGGYRYSLHLYLSQLTFFIASMMILL